MPLPRNVSKNLLRFLIAQQAAEAAGKESFSCPVCGADARWNRANVENGKARRPQLSDLKESGQIEQDADAVMFIWREDAEQNDAPRDLFVAKNKEGTIGHFALALDGKYQRFSEIVEEQMPPAKKRLHSTPVLGREYQEIQGEDKNCPF